MRDAAGTERETLAKQAEFFRIAERDHGLTLAVLASETGIPARTLSAYANSNPFARAKMPLWVFAALCRVVPDEVASIVMPEGKCVTTCEPHDGDAHALAVDSSEYNVEFLRAVDPSSEGGATITHVERARLADIHRRMRARRVA